MGLEFRVESLGFRQATSAIHGNVRERAYPGMQNILTIHVIIIHEIIKPNSLFWLQEKPRGL